MDINKFNRTEYAQKQREIRDRLESTALTLDDVVVGGKYWVINGAWEFTVDEVLDDKVVITYYFQMGKRTMTLDKNEIMYLQKK